MERFYYPIIALLFGTISFTIWNRMLSTSYKKSIETPYLVANILTTLFCVADALFGIFAYAFPQYWRVLRVFTYIVYGGVTLSSFIYSDYTIAYLGSNYKHKGITLIARLALLAANFLVLLTNPMTKLLFSFDDHVLVFSHTKYVLVIMSSLFMIAGCFFVSLQLIQAKETKEKKQCIAALIYNIIPIIALFLQLIPGAEKIPLFSAAFAISLLVIYLFNLNDIRENALHDQYDEEANLRRESLETIRILSADYESIYYVDLISSNMTIYRASEAMAKIFGDVQFKQVNFTQVLHVYLEKMVHNSDKEWLMKYGDPEFLKTLVRNQEIYTATYRVGDEDRYRYHQMKIVKVNPEDEPYAIILGIADVDDSIRKEKDYQYALETAKAQADAASKAKTSFLFNMSHDIRTPMNAIMGFTDLAKKHIDEKDRVDDCLNKVKTSSEHLLSLINDVLDMSRIESGKFNIELAPTNLREAVASTVNMLNVTAKNKDIELSSNVDIKHENLIMDELHLGRVLINIVGNSIKYTNAGGHVDISVKETIADEPGCFRYIFTVKDDGIGMDAEFVKHIFEAFSREETSTVSKIQGTGLGMAITKQLVEKLGGIIEVESEKGVGTTVTMTFEFEESKKEVIKEEETESVIESLKGKRVLLVEDNELNREIATEILQEHGLVVESADDGTVAVFKVTTKEPSYYDFVLMDIQMPKMNGYDATAKIRTAENGKYKDLLIIAMTANAFAEDKKHAAEAGMNGHVSKPIDYEVLFRTISSLMK
ncbi:MAG: ATP-binding protein [Clostridia bacterium]|nr:ATP-binding protein [Clostridia bacterium]